MEERKETLLLVLWWWWWWWSVGMGTSVSSSVVSACAANVLSAAQSDLRLSRALHESKRARRRPDAAPTTALAASSAGTLAAASAGFGPALGR